MNNEAIIVFKRFDWCGVGRPTIRPTPHRWNFSKIMISSLFMGQTSIFLNFKVSFVYFYNVTFHVTYNVSFNNI